jgi:hypothetical protein
MVMMAIEYHLKVAIYPKRLSMLISGRHRYFASTYEASIGHTIKDWVLPIEMQQLA